MAVGKLKRHTLRNLTGGTWGPKNLTKVLKNSRKPQNFFPERKFIDFGGSKGTVEGSPFTPLRPLPTRRLSLRGPYDVSLRVCLLVGNAYEDPSTPAYDVFSQENASATSRNSFGHYGSIFLSHVCNFST